MKLFNEDTVMVPVKSGNFFKSRIRQNLIGQSICFISETITTTTTTTTKSLQVCLTLWNPIDGSPPGSPDPGILNTGVGCHFLLQRIQLARGNSVATDSETRTRFTSQSTLSGFYQYYFLPKCHRKIQQPTD